MFVTPAVQGIIPRPVLDAVVPVVAVRMSIEFVAAIFHKSVCVLFP